MFLRHHYSYYNLCFWVCFFKSLLKGNMFVHVWALMVLKCWLWRPNKTVVVVGDVHVVNDDFFCCWCSCIWWLLVVFTGLVDDDDDDDSSEVVEFSMVNHREPYRIIKQETRLPVIQEASPPKTKPKNSKVKNGILKLKERNSGSKTNLLNMEEQTLETSFNTAAEDNKYTYTNVSLSDDEDDYRKMNFEMLWYLLNTIVVLHQFVFVNCWNVKNWMWLFIVGLKYLYICFNKR